MALTWMAPVSIRHRRTVLTFSMVVAATATGACAGAALAVGRAVLGRTGTIGTGPATAAPPGVMSVTSLVALNAALLLGLLLVAGHAHAVARHRRPAPSALVRENAIAEAVAAATPVLLRRAATAVAALAVLLVVPSTGVRALAWAGLATVFLALVVAAVVVPAVISAAGDRLDRYEFGPVPARRDPAEEPRSVGLVPWLLPAAAALVILAITAGAPAAPSWAGAAEVRAAIDAGGSASAPPAADGTVLAVTALAAAGLLMALGSAVLAGFATDRSRSRPRRSGARRRRTGTGRATTGAPRPRRIPADAPAPGTLAPPASEDPPDADLAAWDGAPA
jgi:hypothetical protein